jgi:thioredoxin reductase (NADPH)
MLFPKRFFMENNNEIYDVAIIGSGPAGLTAGIYTSRADLKTLLLAGLKWGGQLMLTTEVENFPGFPDGIMGPDLMMNMRKQAEKYGTQIKDVNFSQADFSQKPFKLTNEGGENFYSKSVIIATGADTKWLQIKGEQEHIGRGVSSCAPCDAAFYREKKVIVVGGGDSAMEEASVLSKFATEITVIYRGESLRASEIMQKRAKENPKIKFIYNTELTEIMGDGKVTGVKLLNAKTNEASEMPIDGVFVAIGHIPNSSVFSDIERDEKGFIKRFENSKTNIEGVFVAGDVHDYHYMQAVTAAGYGCEAALDVEKYLEELK